LNPSLLFSCPFTSGSFTHLILSFELFHLIVSSLLCMYFSLFPFPSAVSHFLTRQIMVCYMTRRPDMSVS
jgi:hypothetical protein